MVSEPFILCVWAQVWAIVSTTSSLIQLGRSLVSRRMLNRLPICRTDMRGLPIHRSPTKLVVQVYSPEVYGGRRRCSRRWYSLSTIRLPTRSIQFLRREDWPILRIFDFRLAFDGFRMVWRDVGFVVCLSRSLSSASSDASAYVIITPVKAEHSYSDSPGEKGFKPEMSSSAGVLGSSSYISAVDGAVCVSQSTFVRANTVCG